MLNFGFAACLGAALIVLPAAAENKTKRATPAAASPIGLTVVKIPVAKGVSMDDAVESMKSKANFLNVKLVAELPLSKQVEATTGKPGRRMAIYQFCDAMTAKQMVDANIDFAAYLPCRIALIEDEKGQAWLIMLDLGPLIGGARLDAKLKGLAAEVRDNLAAIMEAGANGDL
ncbi:MAG: DUF302 domain-containing protein [Betaproteobacteria bacterium]|nr:DUF302 domain-containing protein [Betaproteobacteria bacterium]